MGQGWGDFLGLFWTLYLKITPKFLTVFWGGF
jgi:hypothetical protein